ncbi:MAG TPA: alpha-glucan family phosphorylase [Candidatus Sumerlaeota bacterium]|nr:alpha-glucan family phosphorylase [Candidatus Sumerlaeota bacterium]
MTPVANPSLETHETALRLAQGIRKLAYNIWWTWNPRAQDLFKALSEEAWITSNHNAIAVIKALSTDELVATLYSKKIQTLARRVIDEFESYLEDENTWGAKHCPGFEQHPVAYFSAEFGMHESLPVYSGGLGILSGDHIKSASDLGIPFIGITLFYRNGYFQQHINGEGWQEESYPALDPHHLPVELVTDANGQPVVCKIRLTQSDITYHAWRLQVGRCTLYMLDTLRPENDLHWREITARVYGGDQTTRVCQELMMGVGGVRLLRALGIDPGVYHMNEGHSAFLLLELMREHVKAGVPLEKARELVREKAVFTTHTPVPAGHDRFSADLLHHLIPHWPEDLGLTMEQFMDLGRVRPGDTHEPFCMTVLALRHARHANAVSELNGRVSREMWRELYGATRQEDVPIGHITNAVHVQGWMNRVTYEFWEQNLGAEWRKHLKQADFWEKVADPRVLSDEAIWSLRFRLKRQMIEAIRVRLRDQMLRIGTPVSRHYQHVLMPDALTIGFSRRFATYKRATLLFGDIDRAAALLNDPRRPVQVIFAGKAHPRDDNGKQLIQKLWQIANDPRFLGKVIFLENYDIQVARYLISGCDVWLNNPRRPLEASGTSGMKIAVHGGLNLSILDGWWREAYDGTNGFAIGEDRHAPDVEQQDAEDMQNLYRVLEQELIPMYYDRDGMKIPRQWIRRIRRAMVTLIPRFNTDRMVAEYAEKYYGAIPSEE